LRHEVDELEVGQAVAVALLADERGDQVVTRRVAPGGQQRVQVGVQLGTRLLDLVAVLEERRAVELALDPVRPVRQPRCVLARGAHDRRDRQRRVGLADRLDEVLRARLRELLDEAAHDPAPAIGRARRERRIDQVAQAPVVVAAEVEDVAVDLVLQWAGADVEQLGDLPARKRRLPGAQEEARGLALEHDGGERGAREPGPLAQLGQHRVVALAPQVRVEVVELRQVELADQHAATVPSAHGRAVAAALPSLLGLRVGDPPAAADVPGLRIDAAGLRGERRERHRLLDEHGPRARGQPRRLAGRPRRGLPRDGARRRRRRHRRARAGPRRGRPPGLRP
jgi:hypothetical protein